MILETGNFKMRYLKSGIIILFLLSGCQKQILKKPSEKVEVESQIQIEEENLPEFKKIIKTGQIPLGKIPEGVEFVPPGKISKELEDIFRRIYFDFDSYKIKKEYYKVLKRIADYLIKNPKILVIIEGHCDERGTREYNLVLGEQRALSVRKFLILMGVPSKRLFTVSYGEDRPLDPRHCEEAWAKNRRCEFLISK